MKTMRNGKMRRDYDRNNHSPYIAWKQSSGFKRAWIQKRTGEKDWAGTGRYLNVARTETLRGGPAGNSTDFPIYTKRPPDGLSDWQILEAFVRSVCAITGCALPDDGES
jgi:hypothetical protein